MPGVTRRDVRSGHAAAGGLTGSPLGHAGGWLVIAVLWAAGAATSAAAQTPADTRPGIGAMVHAAFNSDQNVVSDKQTADFAVNLDWPLGAGWRARGEFGRAAWRFDGQTGLPAPLPTEQVAITRVTASVLRRTHGLPGAYVGAGGGLYRYTSELSPLPRPTRPGLQAIAGMEIGSPRGGLALRLEGQFQAVGGPRASNGPGASPITGAAADGSYSRVVSNVLLNLVFGIGIGWRF